VSLKWTKLGSFLTGDEFQTSGQGWSFNLAIFRVVFLIGVALPWAVRNIRWLETILPGLGQELWLPVSFYRLLPFQLVTNLPLDLTLAVVNILLIGFGIFGFWARPALALGTALSLYLFGIGQNFGKVDHYHHTIWFMALLAAAPSSRVLSADAIRSAIRRADTGSPDLPQAPFDALWALRYVWLLMGLLYFFPGIAKLHSALYHHWASAPLIRNLLWKKWFETMRYGRHVTLPIRADLLPDRLLELAAWGAILFEVSFLVVVLVRAWRPLLAIAGVLFHVGNGLILRIWFTTLIPAYVALLDWSFLARHQQRDKGPLKIFYDGSCQMCRRTVAILETFDIASVLSLQPILKESDSPLEYPQLTYEMLTRDLYVAEGLRTVCGYAAYVLMARRLALLWPVSLAMRLPPVQRAGERIYRRVADARHCALAPPVKQDFSRPASSTGVPLHVVGIGLLALEFAFSSLMLLHEELSNFTARQSGVAISLVHRIARNRPVWPFDKYPTFAFPTPDETELSEVRWIVPGGEVPVNPAVFDTIFDNTATAWNALAIPADRRNEEHARDRTRDLLRSLWLHESPDIRATATGARIYRVRYHLGPGDPPAVPVSESLVATFPLDF
jgi:predicted DCC family thiol-disulfide oxidoreductase YuxK